MTHSTVRKPASGGAAFSVEPGQTLTFDFDLSGASFERSGADLILLFDGGARVALSGFFVAGDTGALPVVQLHDGKTVDGGDFLRSLNSAFDISTAAGPQSQAQTSGGSGEYGDDAGSLINGVERLGSLGTVQWGSGYETPEESVGMAAPRNTGEETPPVQEPEQPVTPENPEPPVVTPEPPVTPEEPEPPVTPENPEPPAPKEYHTRLVVNASASGEWRVAVVDAEGNPVVDPAAIGACRLGDGTYFNPPTVDPVTGELIVTLTEAGMRALQDGLVFEDIAYITVNGQEYPMHLAGNSGQGDYDVEQAEAASDLPGPLYAEWYAHESGDMLDGKNVVLGGAKYNQADVVVSKEIGTASGMGNANITLSDGVEGKVRVAAQTGNGSAYAVRVYAAEEETGTSINAGSHGDVFIEAFSADAAAMGLVAQSAKDAGGAFYKSTADVRGRDIAFTTEANEKTAAGIWASGRSEINIAADRDVRFFSTSTGGTVNYLTAAAYAADQSVVNISGRNVSADSKALQGGGADGSVMSTGFRTTTGSEMNITTADDGVFSVSTYQEHSPYDSPYTGVSWTGGRSAGFTSIGVSASGNVNQWGQGTRSALNVNAGDVTIVSSVDGASDKGTAAAIYAGYGGDVTINTSDLDNTLTIRGDAPSWGVAVFSTNNGTTAINTGKGDDTLNIGASAHNGAAAIGLAAQAGGRTVIDGGEGRDSLTIETTFTGSKTLGTDYMDTTGGAFGMNSAWGYASNEIRNVENVTITADASGSDTGWAYGMFTRDGWGYTVKNIIENSDSALTVAITAKAGAGGQAFAMYGVAGGHNLIQGGSQAGDLRGDSVTLNGNVGGWNNLNEVRTGGGNDDITINGNLTGGSNVFSMGNGADRFTLNGDVTGGGNSLDMGAGDDLVILNGRVAGSLKVIGGDGYDILVLRADSFADFTAKYDAWLASGLGDIQVENIHVNVSGLSDADRAALETYFSDSRFDGYDIGFSSGDVPSLADIAGIQQAALHMVGLGLGDGPEADGLGGILHADKDCPNIGGGGQAPAAEAFAAEYRHDNADETGMLLLQQEILTNFGE